MGPLQRLRFTLDHRWSTGRLSDYLDGELAGRAQARIKRHLGDCKECRAALDGLQRLLRTLARAGPTLGDQTPDLVASVRRRIADRPGGGRVPGDGGVSGGDPEPDG